MDFTIYKNKIPMSGGEVMQRFGYARIVSHHTGKESYSKRAYRDHYPRFHVYLKEIEDKLTFSMHLDQKEASYKGNRMHSGEYEGPLVEQEINNLKQFIISLVQQEQGAKINNQTKEQDNKKAWWKPWQ
jgi:hypothetical protein